MKSGREPARAASETAAQHEGIPQEPRFPVAAIAVGIVWSWSILGICCVFG